VYILSIFMQLVKQCYDQYVKWTANTVSIHKDLEQILSVIPVSNNY
jgi:hypothetical protein